jgi:hypothetical protein
MAGTATRGQLDAFDFEAEISLQRLIGPVEPMIRTVNGSGRVTATNLIFLNSVFHSRKPGEEHVWCATLKGDPHPRGKPTKADRNRWFGRPVSKHDQALINTASQGVNPFYAVSSFKPVDLSGKVYRRIANFSRTHVIVCDDIGLGASAKIPPDRIKLAPSFVLETSPDNYQVGYILETPIDKRDVADILQDALVEQGLGAERDPGQKNVTRYMRLPDGVNGKQKYVDLLGQPFQHQLWLWEPGVRYDVPDIVSGFGLKLQRTKLRPNISEAVRMAAENDPYVKKLDELGLILGAPVDKGAAGTWIPIRCPNVEDHTDADESGSAYCVGGGYKCHHGTCQDVNFSDLQSYLALHFGVDDDELQEMNSVLRQKRRERDNALDEYSKNFLAAAKRRKYVFD